jgi:hypothetical protein
MTSIIDRRTEQGMQKQKTPTATASFRSEHRRVSAPN